MSLYKHLTISNGYRHTDCNQYVKIIMTHWLSSDSATVTVRMQGRRGSFMYPLKSLLLVVTGSNQPLFRIVA